MKTLTTVLLAVASALFTAPASSALACAAVAVPASAEMFHFTSSAVFVSMTTGGEVAPDRLAVGGPGGYSPPHPATSVVVTVPRSCI